MQGGRVHGRGEGIAQAPSPLTYPEGRAGVVTPGPGSPVSRHPTSDPRIGDPLMSGWMVGWVAPVSCGHSQACRRRRRLLDLHKRGLGIGAIAPVGPTPVPGSRCLRISLRVLETPAPSQSRIARRGVRKVERFD